MNFRIAILSVLLLLNASLKISAQITPQWTNTQSGIGDNSDRYNAVVKMQPEIFMQPDIHSTLHRTKIT